MIDIKTSPSDGYLLMKVTGEVDASSSIELDEAIKEVIDEEPRNLVVDCTDLAYISSAGLGVFMSYIEEFRKHEVSLVIFGLNAKVKNVFEILGLDQLLTICETEEEAKAAMA
ncbi:MAG: STAS domain-containing protein [Cyclobacteriaceae bacterium]